MRSRAVALCLSAVAAGCGDPNAASSDPAPSSDEFIAFERDFQGFRSWEATNLGAGQSDDIHLNGGRIVYVSKRAPATATTVPKGTIIVKISGIDTESRRVFAMAKRGGTYNADGAAGWEWFELLDATDPPRISWRGLGPPDGESYAGGEQCNTCHAAAAGNDFVLGPEFRAAK